MNILMAMAAGAVLAILIEHMALPKLKELAKKLKDKVK